MPRSSSHRAPRVHLGLVLALGALPALAEPGIQWEYTGSMQVMGMQMPMAAVRVCSKPGSELTPVDARCKFSDLTTSAKRTRYHVDCAGPDPMSGDGEIRRQGDTLLSVMHMKSAQGDMVLNQTGRKLGTCEVPK
jgi:hypothetical protein